MFTKFLAILRMVMQLLTATSEVLVQATAVVAMINALFSPGDGPRVSWATASSATE